jgi:hypothetical protein
MQLLLLLACQTPTTPAGSSKLINDLPDVPPDDPLDTGSPIIPIEDSDPGHTEEVEPPAVYINELMLDNASYVNDFGLMSDWVELYNGTAEPVPLSSLMLVDSSGAAWIGGDGEIAPGGYYVVYADNGETANGAPFALNADGDTLTLVVGGVTTDRISTGVLGEDLVWARIPDGGGWYPSAWVTVGESNGDAASDTLEIDPFRHDHIYQVQLTLDTNSWSSLSRSPTTYVEGGFNIDGFGIDPIGVRLRGAYTFLPLGNKAGFKFDFNRYQSTSYRGIQKVNMLNMMAYNSQVKEFSIYHMARVMGVPSVRVAYVQLEVNNDPTGLYLFSEAYDDEFMKEFYGEDDGVMIWEPNSGDITSMSSWWDCEVGPCDPSVVERVSDILNSSASESALIELEKVFDMDAALMLIAVEMATGDWDGYCALHNYRVLYNPLDDRISLAISSMDLTISGSTPSINNCNAKVYQWCSQVSSCAERYKDTLLRLADGIEDMDMLGLLADTRVLIEDAATTQTKRPISVQAFNTEYDLVEAYYAALPDALRAKAR